MKYSYDSLFELKNLGSIGRIRAALEAEESEKLCAQIFDRTAQEPKQTGQLAQPQNGQRQSWEAGIQVPGVTDPIGGNTSLNLI